MSLLPTGIIAPPGGGGPGPGPGPGKIGTVGICGNGSGCGE